MLLLFFSLAACRPAASVSGAAPRETQSGHRGRAELLVEADPLQVDRIKVLGELPGSPQEMRQRSAGVWHLPLLGLSPDRTYRYQLRVHRKDLGRWLTVSDPRAWLLDASRQRQSLWITRPAAPPPPLPRVPALRDLVLYEICPRELVPPDTPFARPDSQTNARGPGQVLRHITGTIRSGYFNRLGVNALELMPLLASGWTTWQRPAAERDPWGYTPLSWYAINGDFGSPADLVELVRAAHERGLAVLLDYSLDHGYGGDLHGLLVDLQPTWRRPDPKNRWGLLELDLTRPGARRFVMGALRRFLVDYGIDGFRMDWSESLPWSTWAVILKELRRIKPSAVMVSENPVRELVVRAGFDGAWDFFFQWEAPLLLRRVYTNFDGINRQQVCTQDKLVENLTTWKRGPHAPPGPLVRYIESHDLPRIARPTVAWQHGGDLLLDVDGDGKTPDLLHHGGVQASRLGAALLATVPGAILIFAGQELGAADELKWSYDPLRWSDRDQGLFDHYARLLHLRRRLPVLRSDDLRVLLNDPKRHLLAYSRGTDPERLKDDSVVVVLNFGPQPALGVRVRLPAPGCWVDLLPGQTRPHEIRGGELVLDLPQAGWALLGRQHGPGRPCISPAVLRR